MESEKNFAREFLGIVKQRLLGSLDRSCKKHTGEIASAFWTQMGLINRGGFCKERLSLEGCQCGNSGSKLVHYWGRELGLMNKIFLDAHHHIILV